MDTKVIGKNFPNYYSKKQVTGKLIFGADIKYPNTCYAKILRSKYAHAKIKNIDTLKARSLNGVLAIITGKDILHNIFGSTHKDQPMIAQDKVRYMGDPVAVVAAEDENIAEKALNLIDLKYEKLPAIFDSIEAMKKNAFPIHRNGNIASHLQIKKGDVEKEFKKSDFIFEETFKTNAVEHVHIEPHAATAVTDEDGHLTVWSAVQRPFLVAADISKILKIPLNKVRVIATAVGGGFGGKNEITIEPLISLLAFKTKRPVQMIYTREEEFIASTVRHPFIMKYKSGVKKDGKIVSRKVEIISDSGAYVSWGESVLKKAIIHCFGPYQIPNLMADGYLVYTNNSIGGSMRGFGVTQVAFAYENHTDSIARNLNIDPVKFRLKNIYDEGCKNATDQTLHNVTIREVLTKAIKISQEMREK